MTPADHFPDIQDLIAEIERGGPYASIDDVNRLLTERTSAYNARPQAELGGLSPDDMAALLYGDWKSTGALRLNEDLPLGELAGSDVLADARTILSWVRDHGPVKETAAHNLPRVAVAALLPDLRMPLMFQRRYTGPKLELPGPKNEGDVHWLTVLRHVLLFARLLVRRNGLRIATRARELLTDDRAGELYATLFRTLFRKLDLRALGADERHAGLQSTVAYSFYKLRTAAADWATSPMLAGAAWLDSAMDPPTPWEAENVDFRYFAFHHRVLDPLVGFGLLEERALPGENPWLPIIEYRRTPLFERFLHFDLRQAVRIDPNGVRVD